jgi:hypothetical protein
MSVQKGDAIVWSLVTAFSGTGLGTGIVESVDYEITPETDEKTYGLDGKVKNRTFADTCERVTVTIIPSASTIASAKINNILPAIGADITVTDADETVAEIAASAGAPYHVVSAKKNKQIRGKSTISVTMERFENALLTAS